MAPGNQPPDTPWPHSQMLNAAIASRTTTLRLALCAQLMPLYHPIALAKQLATLDLLSKGRLIVQPTVSWHRDEYECLGVPFDQRGRILDEQLQILRLLWSPSPASFHGEFFQFDDCYCDPKPWRAGGPELWFGGQTMSSAVLRRLCDYGSGFHPFGAPSDHDLAMLRAGLEASGKDYAPFPKVGGIRAKFTADDRPANLHDSIPSILPQLELGFDTICVKPNQFIDDASAIDDFLGELVAEFARL
jgi:alkanesulfonate monooxygenase SsuD/methylene tetrahydromethanopterin reductase-like flavin-dependent oxidoreductase (luciferase family)